MLNPTSNLMQKLARFEFLLKGVGGAWRQDVDEVIQEKRERKKVS